MTNEGIKLWKSLEWDKRTMEEAETLNDEEAALRFNPNRRLQFGTAGLRGRMGPGFDRMNGVTVLLASQGLANYLLSTLGESAKCMGVVVGCDARYNSSFFAHVTAAAFLSKGFRVYLTVDKITATPLTPFWVATKNAAAGIQVTASHNPKMDNGYKVYASNGAQIIPPMDAGISEEIEKCGTNVWPEALALLNKESRKLKDISAVEDPYQELVQLYIAQNASDLCRFPSENAKSDLKFMYTAMHGVGSEFAERMREAFGFSACHMLSVGAQQNPDPEFPTVAFPNPEEKGALDLAKAEAEKVGAMYIVANDPDADRFAAAEKIEGGWHVFSGDELGVLFADWQQLMMGEGLMCCSAVSSRMMSALAQARKCEFGDTLTGFKWMANESIKRRKANSALKHLLAYEEAIGYQLTPSVPDKDGLSALGVWMEMASYFKREKGMSMTGRLHQLRLEVGFFATNNHYYFCHDPSVQKNIFDDFRNDGAYKTSLGGFEIASVRDVTLGVDTAQPDKCSLLPSTPDAQMLTLSFKNGAVVTFRGSGTEPKLKFYCEAKGESAEAAQRLVDQVAEGVVPAFMQPEVFEVKKP